MNTLTQASFKKMVLIAFFLELDLFGGIRILSIKLKKVYTRG